ncbi:MAG: hypothetical protein V1813_02360 [Candidatus Aenigmatarchaeota archaeon]
MRGMQMTAAAAKARLTEISAKITSDMKINRKMEAYEFSQMNDFGLRNNYRYLLEYAGLEEKYLEVVRNSMLDELGKTGKSLGIVEAYKYISDALSHLHEKLPDELYVNCRGLLDERRRYMKEHGDVCGLAGIDKLIETTKQGHPLPVEDQLHEDYASKALGNSSLRPREGYETGVKPFFN